MVLKWENPGSRPVGCCLLLFSRTLIISASRRLTRLNSHSVSRRASSIPFLLLISISCLPSSLWGRRRSRSGFCRLLTLLCCARSRAWPPKYTKTIGIWRASCARQEVTKRSGASLKSSSTFAKTSACQWNVTVKQGMGGHETNSQRVE
jgi:hypothetical protein